MGNVLKPLDKNVYQENLPLQTFSEHRYGSIKQTLTGITQADVLCEKGGGGFSVIFAGFYICAQKEL